MGYLDWVGDHIERIERERDEKRINATEAALELGFNSRFFHGRPWRWPQFGIGGPKYPLSEWRAWTARPEADRRAEWDAMNAIDRRRARGVA